MLYININQKCFRLNMLFIIRLNGNLMFSNYINTRKKMSNGWGSSTVTTVLKQPTWTIFIISVKNLYLMMETICSKVKYLKWFSRCFMASIILYELDSLYCYRKNRLVIIQKLEKVSLCVFRIYQLLCMFTIIELEILSLRPKYHYTQYIQDCFDMHIFQDVKRTCLFHNISWH